MKRNGDALEVLINVMVQARKQVCIVESAVEV